MWRLLSTATVVLVGLAAGPAVAATEWRTYAGGPRRLFFNPAETTINASNVGRLRVKWTFPTGAVVTASPSVAVLDVPGEGGELTKIAFIQSWDGNLYALRTRDGTELWHFHTSEQPAANYPNAASADVRSIDGAERVFIAGGETVYSLDAISGAEVWHFQAGTGCGDGMPPGLCTFTGERNEVESSPIVAGGLVLFGMDVNEELGNGGFYAVDARDGRLVWYFDLETGTTCRPASGDDIRRFDGYHAEAELGLPAGFFASRPGCGFDRTTTGCGNVWSSASVDEARGLLYFDSANCNTDNDPATPEPLPPMPPYDEAIVALHLDGTPAWRWRPREVDPADLDFGAVPNLFTIDFGGATRDVVGVGGKDGTYYVIDREGVNGVSGVRWDDADSSGLPYWRQQVVPGGDNGGIIGTPAVDEATGRVYISTAPGLDTELFNPQRPTVHALDKNTGAIVWQNTAEPDADSSFAPTSAIPGVVFVGKTVGGSLRSYDAETGALLGSVPVGFTLAAAPAVVDGLVIVGAGAGQVGYDPNDEANIAAHTPQPVTALCVPGTPACDEDQDGFDFPDDCNDRDPSIHPRARDRCGQACSARYDARTLATVRTAVGVACPCDAFDGSPGHTRRRYQRCVRRAMAQVAGTTGLRSHCRPEALRELRATTCGVTGAVVCCETKSSGAKGRECRIRPATKCTSSRKVVRHDCSPVTGCADTRCATQGTCAE